MNVRREFLAIAVSIVFTLCGFILILVFYDGVFNRHSGTGAWPAFFVFALGFIGSGGFLLYICGPPKVVAVLHKSKSYTADALRLGGKQILCDIIKWTIIIVIAAIVFLIVHYILYGGDPAAASRSR